MDQIFHIRLHAFARWRSHFVVVGDDRAGVGTQPSHALLDDAIGLAHLLHANQITIVAVTGLAHGHVKLDLVVSVVGLRFTQVPSNARAPQHRTGHAQIERALRRHHTDTDRALFPDAVVGQQGFVFVHTMRKTLSEVVNKVEQRATAVFVQLRNGLGILDLADLILRHAVRQVAVHATGTEVSGMHTRARHGFVHVKQIFALAEGVDQDGRAAAIVAVRTKPHQVVQQTGDF